MDLITKENEVIKAFFEALEQTLSSLETAFENSKPSLNGERYLTDKEVSGKLKISRRTLQDYRDQGKIAYITLGGKILYRESDIEKMLQEHYCKAWQDGNPE